jgi:hypothetical protein
MPTFINKTMMVLLLCLIFIGQSMASMSMFYSMTSMQSMTKMSSVKSTQHKMQEPDSSTHNMSNMPDCDEENMADNTCDTMTTEDCCAQECDCLTTGCSTISAFSTIINSTPLFATASKIHLPNTLTLSQTLTSLYRPPILS